MTQIPTAEDFFSVMNETYRSRTGFEAETASDIGIRLRVLARELERLASEIGRLRDDAFPQTSTGKSLDLHAETRGLIRRTALPARGELLFSRATPAAGDIAVPSGMVCCTADGSLRFETVDAGSIPAGEHSVRIPATALTAGESGNVAPGAVRVILGAAPGVATVTNSDPFTGGEEEESDASLRERLIQSLSEPPNAVNTAFYRQAAQSFPGVLSAQILPRNRGVGTVDVVVAAQPGHDQNQVVRELQESLDAVREIATDLKVYAAAEIQEDIAALVQVAEGYLPERVTADCKAALRTYASSLEVGQPLLLTRLWGCLLPVDGVENFRFVTPDADKNPGPGNRIVAGAVDVERMTLL